MALSVVEEDLYRLRMDRPRAASRGLDRVIDRLTDNRLFDLLVGTWFDRPIDNYLDRSNPTKEPRRRVYLDADGNRIEPPVTE